MGSPATFPIWDAADYGRPQFDVVNGMKSENGVSMVCLTRSLEGDSQPSLEVFSFDPVEWDVVGAANRALMSLAGRFAAISGSGMRDAVNDLTARAFAGGVPKRLTIGFAFTGEAGGYENTVSLSCGRNVEGEKR